MKILRFKRAAGILLGAAVVLGAVSGSAAAGQQAKRKPAKIRLLNINTAAEAQLAAVRGLTPDWAKKIIAARYFKSLDELAKAGLTKPQIDAARPFLTVGGGAGKWRKPAYRLAPGEKVNVNTAALKVLEALPEIGRGRAGAIVEGRPYARIEDIMKVKGIKQKTFAKFRHLIVVR